MGAVTQVVLCLAIQDVLHPASKQPRFLIPDDQVATRNRCTRCKAIPSRRGRDVGWHWM